MMVGQALGNEAAIAGGARVAQRSTHALAVIGQGIVQLAPALVDLGRAPAIHDQMMELGGQAMQILAPLEQRKAPRRGFTEGERNLHPVLPPLTDGLLRIRHRTEIQAFEHGLEDGQQTLSATAQRHQAQCFGFGHQQTQRGLQTSGVECADQQTATADVQVTALRPGHLVQPDFALAERQRQQFAF